MLVISLLNSIITNQIADLEGLCEKVLEERFLRTLNPQFRTSQAHIIDCRSRVTHGETELSA